jgi:NADP-dependent 3-hydroxy acid dehydrogenase YdfG
MNTHTPAEVVVVTGASAGIAFLLSDDAAWITGEDILVSGGYAL